MLGRMKRRYFLALRPLLILAALMLMIAEWLLEKLSTFVGWIDRLLGLERLEARIARLRPHAALMLFLLPLVLVMPAKIFGLALLAQGHVLSSVSVLLATKLAGTALIARIFKVTRPQLLQLPWFARVHARLLDWLALAHAWLDSLPVVMATRSIARRLKQRLARGRFELSRLIQAARKRMKRSTEP